MKTKLTDNDPRLTAYALGELPKGEAEEIARELDAPLNGKLQREVEGIDALGIVLSQTLDPKGDDKLKLSPSQRDAIFRSAKAPTADDVSSAHQSRWVRPLLVTLGAAALVTVSFVVLNNVDSENEIAGDKDLREQSGYELQAPVQPSDANWEDGASMVSSQGVGVEASSVSHELGSAGVSSVRGSEGMIELVEQDWVSRAGKAVARLPLSCGNVSWDLVKNSINMKGELPDKNTVRVEEVLNAFRYEDPSDMDLLLTLSGVELVRCPWDDEHLVAVIQVKNKHSESIEIESAVTFSESVEKYKLVGYAKAESEDGNVVLPARTVMEAGGSHILMYEIEANADIEDAADVLSLNIRAVVASKDELKDDESLSVQYSDRSWTKVHPDTQFALILAHWCKVIPAGTNDVDNSSTSVTDMMDYYESQADLTGSKLEVLEVLKRGLELHP